MKLTLSRSWQMSLFMIGMLVGAVLGAVLMELVKPGPDVLVTICALVGGVAVGWWVAMPARVDLPAAGGINTSVSPADPPERPQNPHERLVADGPGISPESIERGVARLRTLYAETGRPVPRDTQLRAEALRALSGEDI